MVLLKKLNQICANRHVSRAIPAHVACRVLGNEEKPCVLDPICKPCDKTGVWLFYSIISTAAAIVFVVLFWLLRLTRLHKPLGFLFNLLIKPFSWLFLSFAHLRKFYRQLPF